MISLFQNEKQPGPPVKSTAGLSIALHGLLLAFIVAASVHARRIVIFRPMTQGSSQQIAVVAVSRGALAAVLESEHPALTQPVRVPHRLDPAPSKPKAALQTNQSSSVSNPAVTGQGSDAQSMYPAYPTLSPSPQVRDRSLLPQTTQKIIVDVDLDANGRITRAALIQGMGNSLDQLVLDTVNTWQFHPAMVNGQPVSSRIELVFPFDRNYPEID